MEAIARVLTFLANNLFSQVPILIGLITFLGLALQRKRIEDLVGGTLRATIGIVILFIGIDVFSEGLESFQIVLASAMGTEPPTGERSLTEFMGTHGPTIALVITVAFAIHLVLVRAFKGARYLYLTGHLMFWMSTITVAGLVEIAPNANQLTLVLSGAVIVACYWTLQPLWMRPLMRGIVPDDTFGYGHTSSLTCVLTGIVARPFGSKEKHDTEKLRLPRQLSFFKDVNVSTALVISVITLTAVAFADKSVVAEQAAALDEDMSPWVWGVLAGLRLAAGLAVVLYGVRMFLTEIVPAFKGISDKLIPGTRPALDAPTVFPVAPTAAMLGFVSSTLVFVLLLVLFAVAGWFTLAPPMIMLFFVGGGAGIFGNAVAGWRGALIGGAISGVSLAVGQALTWGLLERTAPELATLADPDWYAIAWLLHLFGAAPTGWAVWLAPVAAVAATVITLILLGRHERTESTQVADESATADSGPWRGERG